MVSDEDRAGLDRYVDRLVRDARRTIEVSPYARSGSEARLYFWSRVLTRVVDEVTKEGTDEKSV